MSMLDDFSSPASAAPPATRSPLDEFSSPQGPTAQQRVVVSANDNADEAAKAIKVGKSTGISPTVVQTDLPGYAAHERTQAAKVAVQNPAIAKYVEDNPLAASASNDDYSILDKISGVFSKLSQQAIDHATAISLAEQGPIGEMASIQPGREKLRGYGERIRAGFVGGFGENSEVERMVKEAQGLGLGQNAADFYRGMFTPVEAAIRMVPGLIGGVFGAASGLVEEGTGSVAWGDRLLRDAPGFNAALMGEGGSPAILRMRPQEDFHQFLAEHTPGGPRAKPLSAGETPKDQLWQAKPIVDQAKAESAGAALDDAVAASQESRTKERSPDLYEKFLEAHGDQGSVHVPAQVILDLYEREGKIPLEGDGLFGFVPGLAEKATLAAETGAEIKIPLSKYVANVDESVHEGLKDQIRIQEDGVTREEAKAAVEEQQAKIEAYHGTPHDFENFDLTKIGTGEGAQVYGHGLYFAENRSVSESYQHSLASGSKLAYKGENVGSIDVSKLSENEREAVTILSGYGDFQQALEDYKTKNPGLYKTLLSIEKDISIKPVGQLYKVHINADPTKFLDWDLPVNQHSEGTLSRLATATDKELSGALHTPETAAQQLRLMKDLPTPMGEWLDLAGITPGSHGLVWGSKADASRTLAEAGIPGIKYLDQGSRGKGNGTRNFVVFDDKLVKIVEKNDNPVIQAAVERTIAEKQSLYLEPLFRSGEAVGITQPEFKRYSDLIDRGQESVLAKAVGLAKREAAKRLTPEWRANETRVREHVDGLLYNRPDFAADRFFSQGLMPDGAKVPSELRVKLDDIKFKTEADDYAPLFGFDSGLDMVQAVTKLEQERADAGKGPKWQFKKHVEEETAKQMEATYGKLTDNIAIEASEAALADHNVDLLATEVKMLARLNGKEPPVGREELTSWVRDQFEKSNASEVSYETWRRASEKGGREAEKALLKKDYEEAFITKQRQMLSFLLAREAKGFEREVTQAEKLFEKYTSEVNLPAVDQRYTDQIHRLLQERGIETKRTVENTDYNLQNVGDLGQFVDEQNANGAMIIQATVPRGSMQDLTINQFRDFATMIKSLDHNGRAIKQIEIAGKKEAYNKVIDEVAKNLDTLEKNNFDPDAKGVKSALRMLGRSVDSRLIKAEKLIDWIDKKDPLGAMNSSVLRGLIEGEQAKGDMITKLAKMASDLPADRTWGKTLNDLTTNNELLDWETGKPKKLSNENKIAIALNYGNKSNREIMLKGYRWTEPEVEAYLSRELTPMDRKMVDAIHGLFEPLAPLVEKATRLRSGVAVPLIEGSAFDGMKGGYYPLIEDPRSKLLGQQVDTDLFQKTKFDPLPTANALKQRTGKVYPVDLSISQIHSRLSQTAHAVFMQDPVINANKVLSDPIVREGVAKAFGPEYVTMLDKWIRDIANNGGSDVGFRDDMATWLSRNLRQNVTVQLMGWKASTALVHGGSAAASSVYENFKLHLPDENAAKAGVLAPARLVKDIYNLGLGQFLPDVSRRFFSSQSSVFDGIDFVLQNSGEMRNRQRALQKDFGYQLEKISNTNLVDDAARIRTIQQTYSMAMVGYLDTLTATPVWRATYDHALIEKGLEHDDAVYVADKAVREAHGSASLVSRANIGRGELNKWLTIAYNGYWNHNYNKVREAGKEVAGYDEDYSRSQRLAIGAAFVTAMVVAPALVHHAVRGDSTGNPGKDIAGSLVSQFAGTVPIVNTLTYSLMHNHDPSISPLDDVLKSIYNIGRDSMAANPKHQIKHAGQAVGFLTGLPPTNQMTDTFGFMNDVLHQRQDPKSIQEWARGLMTGSSQEKHRR